MLAQEVTANQTLQLLQERGYRLTNPRKVIVDTVFSFDHAFSSEDVVRQVELVDDSVGRATVFRTLDVLAQLGVLDRLHGPDGCHSYVRGMGDDAHYHHLICSSCGTVVPFEGCNVEEMLAELQRSTRFEISNHMLEVFGLCENCQN
jgi:Fur family transcriptional regulator, ferric uptake regulator